VSKEDKHKWIPGHCGHTTLALLLEAHRQAGVNQLFLYVPLVFRVEYLHANLSQAMAVQDPLSSFNVSMDYS
jgi:hypothetical protein